MPERQTCKKCGKSYPLTAEWWYRDRGSRKGFMIHCKACIKAQVAIKREEMRQIRAQEQIRIDKIHAEDRARMQAHNEYWDKLKTERAAKIQAKHEAVRLGSNVKLLPKNPVNVSMRVYSHILRAKEKGLAYDYTEADWLRALDYFHGCCAVCGNPLNDLFGLRRASFDHWIPLSAPDCPGTIPGNIVPLCHGERGCNNAKSRYMPDEWLIDRFGQRKAHKILLRIAEYFEWAQEAHEADKDKAS